MNWSWRLGRLAGIDVYMHWSFLLLLVYIGGVNYAEHGDAAETLQGVLLVLAVFGCVVLHELGHALTARRYGIGTTDITLLPIGGVARLEKMPDDPRQELWVALAGPAVNVVIAGVLAVAMVAASIGFRLSADDVLRVSGWGTFAASLCFINVFLIFFNMLPAFPMDGGRVLRSLLARWMDYGRATEIAARVGQAIAVLFGIAGLLGFMGVLPLSPMLLLIGAFVFFGAGAELRSVQWKQTMTGVAVRDAMRPRPLTVAPDQTLLQVADYLMSGTQRDFPVLAGDLLVGMLRRDDLVRALNSGRAGTFVGENMAQNGDAIDESETLQRAIERMGQHGVASLPVTQYGQFVGLLMIDDIRRMLSLRAANRAASS